MLVEQTGGDRERELELLRSPRLQDDRRAASSARSGMGQDDVDRLDVPYPLVVLGERIFDGPADHVTMQNVEAARAATEFLLRRRAAAHRRHRRARGRGDRLGRAATAGLP